MNQNSTLAILMGDLVQSERAPAPVLLHDMFNATIAAQNAGFAPDLASPLTITLGDEFQGLVNSCAAALQIARAIRFDLLQHNVDVRFVIGQVDIQTPINPERAWNMMGRGLGRARDKLNEKQDVALYRFSVLDDARAEATLDALGAGVTLIERGWSARQRDDVAALLQGQTPADLAQARQVSVHSIYKVRSAAHYETYKIQWQAMTALLADCDNRAGHS